MVEINTNVLDFTNRNNFGIIVCTSGTRPTAVDGKAIYETDTGKFLIHDGVDWIIVPGGMANPATEDLDMNNHDIIGADKIIADAATDLTFQVAAGQSFVFQKV